MWWKDRGEYGIFRRLRVLHYYVESNAPVKEIPERYPRISTLPWIVSRRIYHMFIKSGHWWSWLNLPTGGHSNVICMGNRGEFFLTKILQNATQRPTKVNCFPYKHVRGWNVDHERCRMTNALILCYLLWKIQKIHAANRYRSFKYRVLPH